MLAPYKHPPKISAHGRTKDWVDFWKTPVYVISAAIKLLSASYYNTLLKSLNKLLNLDGF